MALVDRFLVTGRVAIVSGSGRGIGAACARTLAEAGADVALVARTKADLDAVAAQVSQLGHRSLTIVSDLRDTANAAQVVEQTLAPFGRLDILINNVGGSPPNRAPKPQRAFLDLDPDYLDATFHLNVTTALALAQQRYRTCWQAVMERSSTSPRPWRRTRTGACCLAALPRQHCPT
jgi:7-alpha-hydroxysteroid dehydrogenase